MDRDHLSGWLPQARQCPSPNFDARPGGDVSVIVVHAISLPPSEFGGSEIESFFCNRLDCDAHPYFDQIRDLTVSAHFLVRRDGEVLQFVSTHDRAWHAGESQFMGRAAVNDFSIGIELEGAEEIPFEIVQYTQLASLCRALMKRHPAIDPTRVTGHSDIAPGRKWDPGPHFDWSRFRTLLDRLHPEVS